MDFRGMAGRSLGSVISRTEEDRVGIGWGQSLRIRLGKLSQDRIRPGKLDQDRIKLEKPG
jgi:hypothetical protein